MVETARARRVRVGPALLGLTLLSIVACREATPPAPPRADHLVLVTIDTLRADRVGAIAGGDLTPRIDAIARAGAVLTDASTLVPLTRPAHLSLMSGLLPFEHGVRDNTSPGVVRDVPLLAQLLAGAGFRTAGFVSSIVLGRHSGLEAGFETYSAQFDAPGDAPVFLDTAQRRGDLTLAEATQWLEKTEAKRLFLWLHLYDPHDPYEAPEPWGSRYAEQPYDGEVAFSDELVGRLDDTLTRLGLGPHTLLVVASDHGEGLSDHGETLHGFFAYDSTLRVPVVLRGPGIAAGTRLAGPVSLIDVMPTALDLLGLPSPAGLRGANLAAALGGGEEPPARSLYAESMTPLLHYGWSDLRVVREGRFKYIQAPRPELYDVEADPGESTNLVSTQGARATALRERLAAYLDAERLVPQSEAGEGVPLELLEQLGALGYVGGTAPADTATPGADPKDRIEDFRVATALMRDGLTSFHERRYAESITRFRELLSRGIASFELHFYLARALMAEQRPREAAGHFEEASRRAPLHAPAWEGLAESRRALGNRRGALSALQEGQAALPRHAGLRAREAELWREAGDAPRARAAFETASALAPEDAQLRVRLGEQLRDMGLLEESIVQLRDAVRMAPDKATYWNTLGITLGGAGRMAEAETAFREALARDADDPRYTYNLGFALVRQGRPQEARPWLEKTLTLEPDFAAAREQLAALGG